MRRPDVATDTASPEPERLLSGYSGRIVALLASGWLAMLLGRQALPPLLPTVIEELAITSTQAGIALTVMMVLYAALQYPAGRLADAGTRTTVLAASIVGTVIGFAAISVTDSYASLLVGTALLGIGSAFYFTPARAFLSDLFVERRGQAFGIQTTAGMTGAALAAGLAVAALAFATWQTAFLPSIGLLAVVLLGLHFTSREGYRLARPTLNFRGTGRRLFAEPGIRRPILVRTIVGFSFQAIIGFLPTFLQAEKAFTPTLASASFASIFVVGGMTGPIAGRVSDRLSRIGVMAGGIGLAAAGLGVVVLAGAQLPIVAGVIVMAGGFATVIPVIQAYLMDRFPDASMGGDLGAAKTVFTGLGALGPTYAGAVGQRASYTVAFGGLVAVLLLAGLALIRTES